MRQIQLKGGELLGEQEAHLKLLMGQRESIERDIEIRKELLRRTEEQIKRLEQKVTDTTQTLQDKKLSMISLTANAEAKLRELASTEDNQRATDLAASIKVLSEVAQSLVEVH